MRPVSCAAIIFDMDGVLVDSRAVVQRVWRRWAGARGFDEAAILDAAHGRRTVDTLRAIGGDLDIPKETRRLEEAELSDRDGIKSIPGAPDLLAQLPEGRWAVVTSAGRELAERRLEWAGLRAPACLVTADQVAHGKPSPEGYLRAAGDLGIPSTDCVVIEDSPAGVEAARAAGMRVIGLTTTHSVDALPPTEALLPNLLRIAIRYRCGQLELKVGD